MRILNWILTEKLKVILNLTVKLNIETEFDDEIESETEFDGENGNRISRTFWKVNKRRQKVREIQIQYNVI